MILSVSFFTSFISLADPTNISGTSLPSTTPGNIVMDLAQVAIADKAVRAILPFLKEISNDDRWTALLAAWINFEVKGPPKSVSFFFIFI